MLPLVFLEKQILSCPDPVSMLSRFGSKVPTPISGLGGEAICLFIGVLKQQELAYKIHI